MLLSDKRIMQEMEDGNIIIEPFEPRQLGTNSYDVRLGRVLLHPQPQHGHREFHRRGRREVVLAWAVLRGGRPDQDQAGRHHTCPTEEVVGGCNGFTTSMRSRSSIGRSCLSVCKCAGVGDVGYISKWTMEITNHSHAMAILPVGLRVAQILFYEVGETLREYTGQVRLVERLVATGHAAQALPRL